MGGSAFIYFAAAAIVLVIIDAVVFPPYRVGTVATATGVFTCAPGASRVERYSCRLCCGHHYYAPDTADTHIHIRRVTLRLLVERYETKNRFTHPSGSKSSRSAATRQPYCAEAIWAVVRVEASSSISSMLNAELRQEGSYMLHYVGGVGRGKRKGMADLG